MTPVDNFEYRYDAALKGVVITKYIGTTIRVRIPDTIEGEPVTGIGKEAFMESGIAYVYMPESVTSIGNYAFLGCAGLTSVTIPDSVTSVGENAFEGCSESLIVTYKGIEYAIQKSYGITNPPSSFYSAINGR